MNRIALSIVLLFGICIPCCQKSTETASELKTELSVSPTEIVVEGIGMDAMYSIEIFTNKTWNATSSAPWCYLTGTSGNPGTSIISIRVKPSKEERNCVITITAGELSKAITIKEHASEWNENSPWG